MDWLKSKSDRGSEKNFLIRLPSDYRSQSAMEYLMTYGWAILVIAIILAALYTLGIFNPLTFEPRLQPGGCYVERPYGPGQDSGLSLVGECGYLLPKFVGGFNGKTSNVSASLSTLGYMNTGKFSVSAWIYVNGPSSEGEQMPLSIGDDVCSSTYGPEDNGTILLAAPAYPASINLYNSPFPGYPSSSGKPDYFKAAACVYNKTYGGAQWAYANYPFGHYKAWYFVAETYNGTYLDLYIDGKLVNKSYAPGYTKLPTNYISIGNMDSPLMSGRFWFNGSISNVQIYNASLSYAVISQMYNENIAGAPIDLINLVSWIPLNGNENDYSGNTAGGKFYSGSFNGGWVDNYNYFDR